MPDPTHYGPRPDKRLIDQWIKPLDPKDPRRNPKVDWEGVGEDIAATIAMTQFMAKVGEANGIVALIRRDNFLVEAVRAMRDLADEVRSVPFDRFRESWAISRNLVGLQGRLFIEQCLWSMGGEYRKLVTGFKAIDTKVSI